MSGVASAPGLFQSPLYQIAVRAQQQVTDAANAQHAFQNGLLGQICPDPYGNAFRPPESVMDRRIRLANERVDHLERAFIRTVPEVSA